jgi:hypothetical protein
MAGGGAQGKWTRGHVLGAVAILVTVLAAVPDWVGLLERWGFEAGVLVGAVAWVQGRRAWVVLALCVAAAVVVGRRYRERIKGGLRWVRRAYGGAVAWLAGPVRGDVVERLQGNRVEAGVPARSEGSDARGGEWWKERLRGLEDEDLVVLALAQRGRELRDSTAVVLGIETVLVTVGRVFPRREFGPPGPMLLARLGRACERLRERGYVDNWEVAAGGPAVLVRLGHEVVEADARGDLLQLVRNELARRGSLWRLEAP